MDLRYVERVYSRHHLGSNKAPSFCCCTRYGGSCTLPLERGEAIVMVITRIRSTKEGKWLKSYRWRVECYLRLLPAFKAERELREREDEFALLSWADSHPFIDMREMRRIEKADTKLLSGGKPGRRRIYAEDVQRERAHLKNYIRVLETRLGLRPHTLSPEQLGARQSRILAQIATKSIQLEAVEQGANSLKA